MAEVKFTPGPWSVDSTVAIGAYGVWTENADPRNPGHDGADYQVQICSMKPHDRDTPIGKDERNANARLIAAAPDLLAACRMALKYIEHCVEPSCDEGQEEEDEDGNITVHDGSTVEGNVLRAAIAKATE